MRNLIALLALVAAQAHAQNSPQYCSLLGSSYQAAAFARDNGRDPQGALNLTAMYAQVVPESARRTIVNQIFFDRRYAHVRGESLRIAVRNECMNPTNWKPL